MDRRYPGCGSKNVFFCTPNRLICGPFCECAKMHWENITFRPLRLGRMVNDGHTVVLGDGMPDALGAAGLNGFRQEGKPSMEYRGLEPSFMLVQPVEFRRVVDRFDYCCTAWSDVTEYLDRHTDRLLGLAGTDGKCWVHPGLVEEATTRP
jgi:hypothetical protein